jgi:hypothetical protein
MFSQGSRLRLFNVVTIPGASFLLKCSMQVHGVWCMKGLGSIFIADCVLIFRLYLHNDTEIADIV